MVCESGWLNIIGSIIYNQLNYHELLNIFFKNIYLVSVFGDMEKKNCFAKTACAMYITEHFAI